MSIPKKLVKAIQSLYKQILKLSRELRNKLMSWLLRTVLVLGSRSRIAQAGFVLPTVVMVILVVILVTTAIMFRSFDRSKNASNYRVNQAVLNAAAPAIDRAKRKLDNLFSSPNTRGTPSNTSLIDELRRDLQPPPLNTPRPTQDRYTFADETRLELTYKPGTTTGDPRGERTIQEAWRFPVDTDNNGKFDSFTLYSIVFSTPTSTTSQKKRNPLQARTPPMDEGSAGGGCEAAAGTSASLVGEGDWYRAGGRLKKPFFIYVATVPITKINQAGLIPTGSGQYEISKGNKGFSGLEFQQDRSVLPPSNNAVYYEDDLDIFAGPGLRLNGRIFTNSNLFVSAFGFSDAGRVELYQVSSPKSCFYQAENAKIVVAGNISYGDITSTGNGATSAIGNIAGKSVRLDLFDATTPDTPPDTSKSLSSNTKSVTQDSSQIAYNTQEYERRIAHLVKQSLSQSKTNPPSEVTELINRQGKTQEQALEIYFRNRTRRVPYAEVAPGATSPLLNPQGVGNALRPPNPWMYPFTPNLDGDTDLSPGSSNTKLTLNAGGGSPRTLIPRAVDPDTVDNGKETFEGDRVLVGNGLPANWADRSGAFVPPNTQQNIEGTAWNEPAGQGPRTRQSRAEPLRDLDVTNRDGYWETQAANQPENPLDGIGGLRIVTGAGVYRSANPGPQESKVVWPDTMPQPPAPPTPAGTPPNPTGVLPRERQAHPNSGRIVQDDGSRIIDSNAPNPPAPALPTQGTRPYLQMRATAVYHYRSDPTKKPFVPNQRVRRIKPIACISSFYDPTNSETARNRSDLPDVSGLPLPTPGGAYNPVAPTARANSHNGITYRPPADPPLAQLRTQAEMVYPNGRPVNQLLLNAVNKNLNNLTLAEQGAVDSTACALQILNRTIGSPTITPTPGFTIPHGTIQEVAFLDSRQIKSIEDNYDPDDDFTKSSGVTNPNSGSSAYNLPLEARQPLEIRATLVDLGRLRNQRAPGNPGEYMIPNSGIIYATRDDALADQTDVNLKVGANDFKLDPTRRPNGILLVNGSRLDRNPTYNQYEKGLILASNLPVYVKGDFNLHKAGNATVEEFRTRLAANWSNFYTAARTDLNDNFACRQGDPRLPADKCSTGDRWRSATVIADATTLLSDGFRFGFRDEGDYDLRNNQIDQLAQPNRPQDKQPGPVGDQQKAQIAPAKTLSPPFTPSTPPLPPSVQLARQQQGFLDNNFVTNGLSSNGLGLLSNNNPRFRRNSIRDGFPSTNNPAITDASYSENTPPAINSSYFNNFVTPVQRRGQFAEYLMEVCTKLPVSQCTADDWGIDVAATTKATSILGQRYNPPPNGSQPGTPPTYGTGAGNLIQSGTTVETPRFPNSTTSFARRVAFLRKVANLEVNGAAPPGDNNALVLTPNNQPIPLFIDSARNINCYTYSGPIRVSIAGTSVTCSPFARALLPTRLPENALWYRTRSNPQSPNPPYNYGADGPLDYLQSPSVPPLVTAGVPTTNQPILVPVLQLQNPTATPANGANTNQDRQENQERFSQWLARATTDTTFNLVMATGDTPSRPRMGPQQADSNGGVANLPHFIENWQQPKKTDDRITNISGSFIQVKRSNYATAPWWHTFNQTNSGLGPVGGPFNYPQGYRTGISDGKAPYFAPPVRQWGFDVGLLSQSPDLFSKQFSLSFVDKPNEFFREVGRDDDWMETLLCAKPIDLKGKVTAPAAINNDQRPTTFCSQNT